jgi:hypothetical protein
MREQAVHVRLRRGVEEAALADSEGLRQRRQLAHGLLPQLLAARGDGALDDRVAGRVGRIRDPALPVAADPLGVERAQPLHRLRGPGAEQRVVAAQHVAGGAGLGRVGDDRLEGGQVSVDVVEGREHFVPVIGR